MSGNVFGKAFQVMTFGESHGPYIGLVIDGIKPNLPIDISEIQQELNRRRPGQSEIVTSRQEKDKVEIISGIFEGKTTGMPICMLIRNEDQKPSDYKKLKQVFRPGHAGFSFLKKYGIFDYRGGGRASGRETASRVAAGAVAKQFLQKRGVNIIGYTRQVDGIKAERTDLSVIDKNSIRAPDIDAAKKMEEKIRQIKYEGDSVGGLVEILVKNCPAGLGEPVFHKLEADLAGALMSIGAVKGFEIGSGFNCATQKGSEHNDEFYLDKQTGKVKTKTNNSGGVLGGISNGADLIMRIAVKPSSSIGKKQKTVDFEGKKANVEVKGRHDPCICPRIVPVAEAMVALVILDHLLMQEKLTDNTESESIQSKIETIETQLLLLLAQRVNLSKKRTINFHKEGDNVDKQNLKSMAEELGFKPDALKKLRRLIQQQITEA